MRGNYFFPNTSYNLLPKLIIQESMLYVQYLYFINTYMKIV